MGLGMTSDLEGCGKIWGNAIYVKDAEGRGWARRGVTDVGGCGGMRKDGELLEGESLLWYNV